MACGVILTFNKRSFYLSKTFAQKEFFMESSPSPHEKLSDDQIKEYVCDITTELHKLREDFNSTIYDLEQKVYLLKKHFCPEKFVTVKMNLSELSDLYAKAYDTNVGEVQRMERPKVENEQNDTKIL